MIVTLTTSDSDDGLTTTVHSTVEEAQEALRVNYAPEVPKGHWEATQEALGFLKWDITEHEVHKARPRYPEDAESEQPCATCARVVKKVPGGQGPTWVHLSTGAVVGSDT
jgi:hypothetical protein